MKRILMIALAFSLLLAACSDDDPVRPDRDPKPAPVATTPDSLMSLYRTSMADMDSDLLDALLGEHFTLILSQWDPYIGPTPTDYMTRGETILAVENMAGGNDVTNWEGNSTPGVTGIAVQEWSLVSGWNPAPSGHAASSIWYLNLTVDRGPDHPSLAVAGDYEVIVSGIEMEEQQVVWTLFRLDFRGRTTPEDVSLMAAHLAYLTNESPTATFEITERPGVPWPTFTFDGGGSSDSDNGLADNPFRWQLGEGAEWNSWRYPFDHVFETEEPQQVTLEVRDRWGATAQATETVTPTRTWLPFPDSPAQLMANFQVTYEQLDFQEYRRLLHPDFQMILQQETIDEFPDVGTTLDLSEELRIHQRMFSGDDLADPVSGALIPGLEDISFRQFNAPNAWQMTPANDLFPNAEFTTYDVDFMFSRGQQFSILKAEGLVRFYVTSRDSLHEGSVQRYYQMIGQLDLTGGFKAVETANYGSIKAIYR